MGAKKEARSIRVNLRFGPRTDPALIREITALPPYRRAKLLRRLLETGWRASHAPPAPAQGPASTSISDARPTQSPPEGDFSDELLSLVGKSVRL